MAILNDDGLKSVNTDLEVINSVGQRTITHVIHDIDGTHSLIRDWPPVMSFVINWAMHCGLDDNFDSVEMDWLVNQVGKKPVSETDRFCIESAGLSALTQMEFGIRRAIEKGNIPGGLAESLTAVDLVINKDIIAGIWNGNEHFDQREQSNKLTDFISDRSPRLFILYEKILNQFCRDKNLKLAKKNPEAWQVPGSMVFMEYLKTLGCINYFVTGAVVYAEGGIFEEVTALGFKIGDDALVKEIRGSSWDKKMPKKEVFNKLIAELNIDPAGILVIGDGRSEIQAGVELGCVSMSRLPTDALRQRELHRELKTNYIIEDYTDPLLQKLIQKEQ